MTVTRGLSLRVETKSTQARPSRQRQTRTGAHQRRESPSRGRSPIHAGNVASHALPTPRRWAPHVRRPCLWVIRCLPNVPPHTPAQQRERPIHQFPQPGLPGDGPRSAISFTSPKLTRKPPPPGSLPWSPYVATAPHRDAHQSYKPIKLAGQVPSGRLRHCVGVIPKCFRNSRVKWAWSANPQRCATAAMVLLRWAGLARASAAAVSRCSRSHGRSVIPARASTVCR